MRLHVEPWACTLHDLHTLLPVQYKTSSATILQLSTASDMIQRKQSAILHCKINVGRCIVLCNCKRKPPCDQKYWDMIALRSNCTYRVDVKEQRSGKEFCIAEWGWGFPRLAAEQCVQLRPAVHGNLGRQRRWHLSTASSQRSLKAQGAAGVQWRVQENARAMTSLVRGGASDLGNEFLLV